MANSRSNMGYELNIALWLDSHGSPLYHYSDRPIRTLLDLL